MLPSIDRLFHLPFWNLMILARAAAVAAPVIVLFLITMFVPANAWRELVTPVEWLPTNWLLIGS